MERLRKTCRFKILDERPPFGVTAGLDGKRRALDGASGESGAVLARHRLTKEAERLRHDVPPQGLWEATKEAGQKRHVGTGEVDPNVSSS